MRIIKKACIEKALRSVIHEKDDVVVIHPNVFSFGQMENPVEDLLDVILTVVGPRRTLLMPTFTFSFCKTGWFHHKETPSDTGVLTEAFRKRPGVLRTPCAINSFAVQGPLAKKFMNYEKSKTLWGSDSLYHALYQHNALILGLGESLALKSSIFHYAEEIERVPYRYFKTFSGTADYGNKPKSVSRKMFVRRVDIPVRYDYSPAVEALKKEGKLRKAVVGASFIEAFKAKDAINFLRHQLKADPLAVLANRKEYEGAQSQKSISFLGSANFDLLAKTFCDVHQKFTPSSCRIVPVPFGQGRQHVLDEESLLRVADPNYVVFLERAEDILSTPNGEDRERAVKANVARMIHFVRQARGFLSGFFFVSNFEMTTPSPLGNADGTLSQGSSHLIEMTNRQLKEGLKGIPDVQILDFQALVKRFGYEKAAPKRYWAMGKIPYGHAFAELLSQVILGLMLAREGRTSRLLVVDLDNTLWGGVIGDEGIEGIQVGEDYPGNLFRDFQLFLKGLSQRGIALAICSKNNEAVAMKGLQEKSGMILRKKDFADWRINWIDKATNIRSLCKSLNLGPSSVMVLDDSAVEREGVRLNLPDCVVPELPENVSEWPEYLSVHPYLQCGELTREDFKRARQYTSQVGLEKMKSSFKNVDDFLASLDMKLSFERYNSSNMARIQQLIAKTNQFNTTTKRYSQRDLEYLVTEKGAEIYAIRFQDKFFEPEIIGVIIVMPNKQDTKRYLVDSFVLSCRVLGRNIETATLGWLCQILSKRNVAKLMGTIIPTDKNQPVRTLYTKHGFKPVSKDIFELPLRKPAQVQVPNYFNVVSS